MTIPKLLFSHLRRSRPLFSLSTLSHGHTSYVLTNHNILNQQPPVSFLNSNGPHFAAFHFPNSRSFWSRSKSDPELPTDSVTEPNVTEVGADGVVEDLVNGSYGEEESILPGLANSVNVGEESILPGLVNSVNIGEESILPVRTLISLLDGFHNLTGLPWWLVIASTTLIMRLLLMPLLIFQLKKLTKIGELFPRLPPPLPPPFSGGSYINQISLFRRERRAIGCPSFLWFPAYFCVQVPCFLLWMSTIRRMSLDHHAGFDCGGALWFQNLTEFPHGVLGPIFPLLVAGLHYTNVQLSFKEFSAKDTTGILGLLAKYYKMYLDILTLPLFCIAYAIPQGSLVYWVTNSSLTLVQQLFIKHPAVRKKLGLPEKRSPTAVAPSSPLMGETEPAFLDSPIKEVKVSAESLSPEQLCSLSRQLLSQEQIDNAMVLLRVALQKDPDFVEAMVYLGWALVRKGFYVEAKEHLERAIPKLYLTGESKEVKHRLILASQLAGVACIQQGKKQEGLLHFERVVYMGEPEDPASKVHYYDTLRFEHFRAQTRGNKVSIFSCCLQSFLQEVFGRV
ncbi:ALBINO3-like protein 2, chloroplastic isoform X2 [Euphorbia lathyris]|uniref:ALBINO3-like protein 2, chloroplastic isoform X2 n=1 Tax=Euphorbia lathyris TaxID=212925 RepID=UPI0033137AD9